MSGKVKTVYIAGPITGDPNHKKKFQAAENSLYRSGYAVMNPVKMFGWYIDDGAEYGYVLEMCLEKVEGADILALLPGWESSPGAKAELSKFLETKQPKDSVVEFEFFDGKMYSRELWIHCEDYAVFKCDDGTIAATRKSSALKINKEGSEDETPF